VRNKKLSQCDLSLEIERVEMRVYEEDNKYVLKRLSGFPQGRKF